jgi:hypothetical protein
MNSLEKNERYEYILEISKQFSNTLFQFVYEQNNKINWSKKRTFEESNKVLFYKKESYFRSALCNKNSDEIRLDFDYKTIEENINRMRGVIEVLLNFGIDKFETYLSGGKGTHLHFRYNYSPFENHDRKEVRKSIIKFLNLGVEIDDTLNQTNQVIGMEGYIHRKTKKLKERITIDYNSHKIVSKSINFEYLNDVFVNKYDTKMTQKVLKILEKNKNNKTIIIPNLNTKTTFQHKKIEKYLNRFKECYFTLNDGKKRFLDMVTRYLLLTTKNTKDTEKYLYEFCKSIKITINIPQRVILTQNSMKAPAIFIYKDILTKEVFYENWSA